MANLMMMKLVNLFGDSNQPGYHGWVDLLDCSIAERKPACPTNSSFSITKKLDTLSARLCQMCAIGTPIALITIHIVDAQTGKMVRQIICNNVILAGYVTSGSADGLPLETIELDAATIR